MSSELTAESTTAAPAPADAEKASTAVAPAPSPAQHLAHAIHSRLMPFLSEQHIEVEARLCSFSAPQLDGPATAPTILSGSYGRIQVGVSADDFARLRRYAESEKKLTLRHVHTQDVITRDRRFTYAIAEDGSETFVGSLAKRRLCNVEVFVPDCPYDVRLSVSTEVPSSGGVEEAAPATKPRGFVREKNRWVATDGSFEYAFTRVGAPGDKAKASYEVEVEGVRASSKDGVTEAWLEELMDRLLAMARLEGNTGLPKNVAPEHHGGVKRRW